jgi:Na+/glutamate symporter
MELSMRRWRPGHLLASWAAYWAGLAGVALGPAIPAVWRATHLPQGHGTITAMFDNSVVNITVIEDGVKTFAAATPFGTIVAWLVGPPLVLWLVWLAVRHRPTADVQYGQSVSAGHTERLAAGTAPASEWRVDRDDLLDRVPVDRKPVRTPNP